MKIGILTFHWATNYGAVLQCYALQSYLESLGHEVEIINYKPRQYDDNLYTFLRFRKFLKFTEYINGRKKEKALAQFRKKYISQTIRAYSNMELPTIASRFDVIVSGSDQVVNPSFLLSGEGNGIISPAYFLGFPFNGIRIGYALSFGCVSYPDKARKIAAKFIEDFNVITVRERTGVDIAKSMGRDDAKVVPDPTILMKSDFYNKLADISKSSYSYSYVYSFFIRYIDERKDIINNTLKGESILWNNDDGDYSIEGWLNKIRHANMVVTDSFHCVVMCLKFHVPFFVITEKEGNIGMNDRLYTLLGKCKLLKQILHKSKISNMTSDFTIDINWDIVDVLLSDYSETGKLIFKTNLPCIH